jgi:hypothetical protein
MFGFFLAAAVGILTSNKGKSTPVTTPVTGNSGSSVANASCSWPTEKPAVGTYVTTPDRVVSHSGWAYRNVTRSRESYTGFEDISICRPRFIFFKVSGLRPNTRHFAFFDKINVTGYINTDSFTYAQRETLSRNSPLRNPGEKYVGSTGFPTDQGGPTSVIRSNDAGEIEGCFYLQSNETLSFPAGNRQMVFLDISAYKPLDAISFAQASFTVDGGVEEYLKTYYTETVRYWDTWTTTIPGSTVYVPPIVKPAPPVASDPSPTAPAVVPKPAPVVTTRKSDDDDAGLKATHHNGVVTFTNTDTGKVVAVHDHSK